MNKRWRGIKYALEWIAINDEGGDLNPHTAASYVTTLLIADCTGHNPEELGRRIVAIRKAIAKAEKK